jgi:sterol O-acyltransferase
MARISLKIHGYYREKMLFGLKEFHMEYATFIPFNNNISKSKTENINLGMPEIKIYTIDIEIKKYLYYLFCPSLIYRDNYPRITHFRWNMIIAHISNFTFCILFYYILMRYICDPYFILVKVKAYYSLPHFIFDSLRFAMPAVCFLVVGNFLLLHTWNNLWSEILRHGDRRFYEDWWNCTNFEEYYRKWNMVVHEWLYYYVYNDVIRFSLGKLNRTSAKFIVFTLSVIVHELIIWLALGFFYPVLSFFFGGPGIIFTYIKPKQKQFNIMFWFKLFIGTGLILALYLREVNMRFVINQIGLIEPWHEYVPRIILMYFNSYQELIEKSKYY